MATVIASNLTCLAGATGTGNQAHLQYAATQQRWWLLVGDSALDTSHVRSYVSSSNDDTSASWSAGTTSPVFPTSHVMNGNETLGMGCVGFANGSTDVAHVSIGVIGATNFTEHIRATFTGASSITWESWNETSANPGSGPPATIGNVLGVSTTGVIHETTVMLSPDFNNGYPMSRKSTNADTTATWTNGFGSAVKIDSQANFISSYALAQLASGDMLCVYGNGGAAEPNTTGLRSNKTSSGAWGTTGSVVTGNGTTSQNENDCGLCGVDTTHIFSIRRAGASSFDMQMYSGTAWSAKTAPPSQAHKAGSGIFLATDSTDLWMFVLDSTGNNAVMWNKYTVGSDSWGSWTTLETAGSTARNYISGYPKVSNNQIGVIWTAVNGSNFDIVTSALSLAAAASGQPPRHPGGPELALIWDQCGVF